MSWKICDMCGQPHGVNWSNKRGECLSCEAMSSKTRPIESNGAKPPMALCEKWVPRKRVFGL